MTDISNTNQMKSANSNKICRACLSIMCSAVTGYYLFDAHHLAEKFASCSTLKGLNVNDNLPKMLCNKCKIKLISFYEFQQMCLASDKYLRDLKPGDDDVSVTQASLEYIEIERKIFTNKNLNILNSETPKDYYKHTSRIIGKSKRILKKSELDEIDFENDIEHLSCKTSAAIKNVKESLSDPLDVDSDYTCDYLQTLNVSTENLPDSQNDTANKNVQSKIKPLAFPKQCPLCPRRFSVEHSFEAHQRVHQGLAAYPCTYLGCDKGFKTKTNLDIHVQKWHLEKQCRYSCEQTGCENIFSTRTSYSLHMQKIHNIKAKSDLHICEICGKCLSTASNLKLHRYTHDKTKYRFICKEPGCQKRFTDMSNFKVHMRRHAGIKKYKCPSCGVYKTSSTELKIHINFHTREKTWLCRYCSKVFYTSSHRLLHERTVHQQARNYKCRYCEDAFLRPMELKYHEMRHTGEKPFKCDECGRHFRKPGTLRTHRKIHERQKAKHVADFVEYEELEELND